MDGQCKMKQAIVLVDETPRAVEGARDANERRKTTLFRNVPKTLCRLPWQRAGEMTSNQ